MRIEERFIIRFEHRQVNARGDGFDLRGNFITCLIGLYLHLAGIKNHMGARENPFAFDDHAAARHFTRSLLGPGFVRIGVAHRGKHFHDRVRNRVRLGFDRRGRGGGCRCGFGGIGIRRPGANCDERQGKTGGEKQCVESVAIG